MLPESSVIDQNRYALDNCFRLSVHCVKTEMVSKKQLSVRKLKKNSNNQQYEVGVTSEVRGDL